jgi:UPF0755 protein
VRRPLLLAALAVVLAAYVWYRDTEAPLRGPSDPPLTLEVPPGTRADGVGRELQRLGLVRHPLVFRMLVHWRGAGGQLRAGRYTLPGPLSLNEIVDLLQRGEATRWDVTFPEGRTLEEMSELASAAGVAQAAFRAAASDPTPIRDLDPLAADLEGYLFPDTYDVPPGEGAARALVVRMVQRFRRVIAPELTRLAASGFTLRQLVTLASLVELETGRPEERPRVAAVFLNRLRAGMLLQTDPTVIFALRKAGPYDGNIRKKDLGIESPYNTYKYPGLPPGPIASPGRAALLAVLEPAPGGDLYFVSRNDGTHEFSGSLRQHEQAVTRFQRSRQRAAAPPAAKGH